MTLVNPFGWLSSVAQRRAFFVLLALGLGIQYAWSSLNNPLKTEAAPGGVLSFEVAGTLSKAQSMLLSWGPEGQIRAAANTGLDYLFLIVYGGTIALGCVLVMEALSSWRLFARAGLILAWLQIVAILLDSLEDYAMLQLLLGERESWLPVLARWCSMPKGILYGAGMIYVGVGVVLFVGKKIFQRNSHAE
jgi:hypothetical protein